MQQRNTAIEVSSSSAQEVLAQPMVLDAAVLSHIAGGGPNGGWTAQGPNGGWTAQGPNGGWTAANPVHAVTPSGPNGGWK